MKLEKQFKSENNKLYFLYGNEFDAKNHLEFDASECLKADFLKNLSETSKLLCIKIAWSKIGLDEENYDESFLALVRDFFKSLEDKKIYAFILPLADKIPNSSAEQENFIASFKHCARRIKDCKSVVGFALADCVNQNTFMEELLKKHDHYIFFSKNPDLLKNKSIVEF